MKNILTKIFIAIWLFLAFFSYSFAAKNQYLDAIKDDKRDVSPWANAYEFTLNIANSLISIFFIIAIIYFFIIVIKLILSENSEEEAGNFKKWFIWISVWLIVMQLAKVFVNSMYNTQKVELTRWTDWLIKFAGDLLNNIIKPLTELLETWAAFLFVLIAIFAFYKLITSNWDDSSAKSGKMMIFYAIIWFIIIKVSATLIKAVYWECKTGALWSIIRSWSCNHTANISWVWAIITNIINWLNSFIWIWVIIMVIYVWMQIIFSKWDEEKLTNWKKSIIYIVIWVWILIMNYLILTFFLNV